MLREDVAQCLGVYSRSCPGVELQSLLAAGPLAPPSPKWDDRLGAAALLGAIWRHAPLR